MIVIKDMVKTYHMGDTVLNALQGVSLTIEQGEFVAIMGPSGSGKSTLMHILGLLDIPTSGSYSLLGSEVSKLEEDDLALIRRRRIGFIFQQFNLLARTTAEENVGLPLIYAEGGHDAEWASTLLTQVGLGDRLHHKPNELSGGQQQRVAIARALINRPDIILADEPTGNLDSNSERDVMTILTQLNQAGITVVIVTHNPEIAHYVKRVVRMKDGKVQADELNKNFNPSALLGADKAVMPQRKSEPKANWMGSHYNLIAYCFQAIRALWGNKLRLFLSILGIMIGVSAVIAMLALGRGASQSIEAQLSSLGSNLLTVRPGSTKSGGVALGTGAATRFTLEDAPAIEKDIPNVVHATSNVSGKGQLVAKGQNWATQVIGTSPSYELIRSAKPAIGRFFTEEENRQRARVALVGQTVVRELFGGSNPVGETMKINKVFFLVIGVLPEKGSNAFQDQDDMVVIPVNTAMRRLLGKLYVDSIDVQVTGMEQMQGVQDGLETLLKERHRLRDDQDDAFQIRNMADIQQAMSSTSRIMSILLAVIASISLLVGGIGIMNIMLVSVAERTREIGLRKALGAKRSDVMVQFLVESVLISMLGGFFGILLGVGASLILGATTGWSVIVSADSVGLSVAFSASIGIVFGLWPARTASALHPIQALRSE